MVIAGRAFYSHTERDSYCWKTLRKLWNERKRGSALQKSHTTVTGHWRWMRSDVIATNISRDAERKRENGRVEEEHDTNRFVAELRPTWCDLGLWGLLLARASILISVDILCAYYGKHRRVFSRDLQRSPQRTRTYVYTHMPRSHPHRRDPARPVDNNNCTLFTLLINISVPRRCYCDRYGE